MLESALRSNQRGEKNFSNKTHQRPECVVLLAVPRCSIIPPPYWPPFRWSDISEYLIFCDIVIPDGITTPAPYFWKPWMAPYVAAGAFFFSRKMAPIFLEALDEPLRCRRRFFFSEKWPPDFSRVMGLFFGPLGFFFGVTGLFFGHLGHFFMIS